MAIQLDATIHINLTRLLAVVSKRLTKAHMAFASGCLKPRHISTVYQIRSTLITLLATFEDGKGYGSVEPDMLQAMRHIETAANAFLCRIEGIDDVRAQAA